MIPYFHSEIFGWFSLIFLMAGAIFCCYAIAHIAWIAASSAADGIRSLWRMVPVGTRSVLVGVHCPLIHPWFVALAWWRLYGFPVDPRLWVAFFTHDLGYWGKKDMDGDDGKSHPTLGADICAYLFDAWPHERKPLARLLNRVFGIMPYAPPRVNRVWTWRTFLLSHSRSMSKRLGLFRCAEVGESKLCVADKYSFLFTPQWLYYIQSHLSGEIREYIEAASRIIGPGKDFNYWHEWFSFKTSIFVSTHGANG